MAAGGSRLVIASTALFLVGLAGAAAPTLTVTADGFAPPPRQLDLRLRSALLDRDAARPRYTAQAATRGSDATPAPARAAPETPGECDLDCDSCMEADRQARYLLQRRESSLRVHRGFALGAWGSLAVTTLFGTVLAVNRETWFGGGNCAAGAGVFGSYGCGEGLVGLHEAFTVLTTSLYVTSGVIAATAPDPDRAASRDDPTSRALRLHKALAWVHGAGMVLLPILGILAAHPEVVGIDPVSDATTYRDFRSSMRSIHTIVGYTTFVTFSVSAVLDLL